VWARSRDRARAKGPSGRKVDRLVLAVYRGALGASVLEEFLALGGSDELHVFDSCLGGPQRSVREQTDRAGSARSRTQIVNARSERIEAAPAVTAALCWRGRYNHPTLRFTAGLEIIGKSGPKGIESGSCDGNALRRTLCICLIARCHGQNLS
jgi:hypothetical protein